MALQVNGPLGPSLAALAGQMEEFGLSKDVLTFWLMFCRAKTTGSVTFHHFQGRIELYEPHYKKLLTASESHLPQV